MLQSITFTEDWRCFEKRYSIPFRPGMNLLVGDQGCGKSSLLLALRSGSECKDDHQARAVRDKVDIVYSPCASRFFDFEKDNPRTLPSFGKNVQFQIGSMSKSHGETAWAILESLEGLSAGDVLMVDEPDSALSPRSVKKLVQAFKSLIDKGVQIVAAVHNPYLIGSFPLVLSLEHRLWMSGADFLDIHLKCDTCGCYPCGCGG